MRKLLSVYCILLIGNVFSQSTFFLAPTLDLKTSINRLSYEGDLQTEYYKFDLNRIGVKKPLRLGFKIGYRLKNTTLSTGMHFDGVENSDKTYAPYYQSNGVITPSVSYGWNRSNQSKIYFCYQYFIKNGNKERNLSFNAMFSISYRSGPTGIEDVGSLGFSTAVKNKDIYLEAISTSYTGERNKSVQFGLGISYKAYLHKSYLFDLNFRVDLSRKHLYFNEYVLSVIDTLNNYQNSQVVRVYHMNSGIYFGISRDIKLKKD